MKPKSAAVASGIVVVLVVSAIAAYSALVPSPPPPEPEALEIVLRTLSTGDEVVVAGELQSVGDARFLPDASVTFSGEVNGTWGIWHVRFGSEPVLLWAGQPGDSPSPSRDGSRIVFTNRSGAIVLLDLGTGLTETYPPEVLSPAPFARSPTFRPDGGSILFEWDVMTGGPRSTQFLGLLNLSTGDVAVLREFRNSSATQCGAVFLPDGEHIVFDLDGLHVLDLPLNASFRLTDAGEEGYPRVSGTGDLVVYQMDVRTASGRLLYGVRLHDMRTAETVDLLPITSPVQPRPDIDLSGEHIVYVRGVAG